MNPRTLFRRPCAALNFAARSKAAILVTITGIALASGTAFAQEKAAPPQPPPQPPPPLLSPAELDTVVARIALYPDPLLAQILTASTFADQVPGAAKWANQNGGLTGDALARAMEAAQLPYDPSVQALIPLPPVLNMMATDVSWTTTLGDAFLAQPNDVMDAVQRMRLLAYRFGYLRTNRGFTVVYTATYVEVLPVTVGFYVVPTYNPLVVFVAPRPGIVVGAAIGFGVGFAIGPSFAPWGWGHTQVGWASHAVVVNGQPWGRTWANRASYRHPYEARRFSGGPRGIDRREARGPEHREPGRAGIGRPVGHPGVRPEGPHRAEAPRRAEEPHRPAAGPHVAGPGHPAGPQRAPGVQHPAGPQRAAGPRPGAPEHRAPAQHPEARHPEAEHPVAQRPEAQHPVAQRPEAPQHEAAPQQRPSFPQHAAPQQQRPSFPQRAAAPPPSGHHR